MVALIETNNFPIGKFIFIFNTEWMAKKELDASKSFP